MKQIARRRMQREVAKRNTFQSNEKMKLIINLIKTVTNNEANEIRLNAKIIKKNKLNHSFRNHCLISGRAHSIYSHYKLSRNEMRRFFHKGLLYGVIKSS